MICTENVKSDKYLEYSLTQAGAGGSLKDHIGEVLDVEAFALYERPDRETGEMKAYFSLITPEGEVYGTGSQAFCSAMCDRVLAVFAPEEIKRIRIVEKVSNQGRAYIQPVPVK